MRLRGGLIVSVQAWPGSALDDPHVIAAMARAAQDSGAVAVRIAGRANICAAVRAARGAPDRRLDQARVCRFRAVHHADARRKLRAVVAAGAEIVAFDATPRGAPRRRTVASDRRGDSCGRPRSRWPIARRQATPRRRARRVPTSSRRRSAAIPPATQGHAACRRSISLPRARIVGRFTICEGGVARRSDVRAALDAGPMRWSSEPRLPTSTGWSASLQGLPTRALNQPV